MIALPAELEGLRRQLAERGFHDVEQRTDKADFGNCLLVLADDQLAVRFVRDRGQWFLDIQDPLSRNWFAPVDWMASLDRLMPPLGEMSLGEQADFVSSRLDEMLSWVRHDPATLSNALYRWQVARAKALGMPFMDEM